MACHPAYAVGGLQRCLQTLKSYHQEFHHIISAAFYKIGTDSMYRVGTYSIIG